MRREEYNNNYSRDRPNKILSELVLKMVLRRLKNMRNNRGFPVRLGSTRCRLRALLVLPLLLCCIPALVLAQVNPPSDPTRLIIQGGYLYGYGGASGGSNYPILRDLEGTLTTNTILRVSLRNYDVVDDGTTTSITLSLYAQGEGNTPSYFFRGVNFIPAIPNSDANSYGSPNDIGTTAITNRRTQCTYSVAESLPIFVTSNGTTFYRYLLANTVTPPIDQFLGDLANFAIRVNSAILPSETFQLIKIRDPVELLTIRCQIPSTQITGRTVFGLAMVPGDAYQRGEIGTGIGSTQMEFDQDIRLNSIVLLENNFTFRPASTPGGIYAERLRMESDRQGAILEFSEGVTGVDRDGSDFRIFDFNRIGGSTESVVSAVAMHSSRTYRLRFSAPLAAEPTSGTQQARDLFGLERYGAIDGVSVGRLGTLFPTGHAYQGTTCVVPQITSAQLNGAQDELTIDFSQDIYRASARTTADFILTNVTDTSDQDTALGSVSVASVNVASTRQFVLALEYRDRLGNSFSPSSLVTSNENFTVELKEGAFRCDSMPFVPADMIQSLTLRVFDTPPQISLLAQVPDNICATSRMVSIHAEDFSPGISKIEYKLGSNISTVCTNNTSAQVQVSITPSMGTAVLGILPPFILESEPQAVCVSVFETTTDRVTSMALVIGAIDATPPTLANPMIRSDSGTTSVSVEVTDSSLTCGVASDLLMVRAASVDSSVTDCSSVNFNSSHAVSPILAAVNGIRTYTYLPFITDNDSRICFQATDGAGGSEVSQPSNIVMNIMQPVERTLNARVFLGGAL